MTSSDMKVQDSNAPTVIQTTAAVGRMIVSAHAVAKKSGTLQDQEVNLNLPEYTQKTHQDVRAGTMTNLQLVGISTTGDLVVRVVLNEGTGEIQSGQTDQKRETDLNGEIEEVQIYQNAVSELLIHITKVLGV